MTPSVPYTTSTQSPRLTVPDLACDAHIHLYDATLSTSPAVLPLGTAENYQRWQALHGTSRCVIVQPAAHGFDNQVTLNGIATLGRERTRGVAVINPDITDVELQVLNEGGIRGIRFTLFNPETAMTRFEWVTPLAHRVAELGWHVQVHWRADQIVTHEAILHALPGTVVFDHMARLPQPQAQHHEAFGIVTRLLDTGRAWVKLSGPYLDDSGPDYASRAGVVHALCRTAPNRLVWGSDWPHPTESTKPDDARLLDLFGEWIGDSALRQRILVDNPAELYGFD